MFVLFINVGKYLGTNTLFSIKPLVCIRNTDEEISNPMGTYNYSQHPFFLTIGA